MDLLREFLARQFRLMRDAEAKLLKREMDAVSADDVEMVRRNTGASHKNCRLALALKGSVEEAIDYMQSWGTSNDPRSLHER